MTGGRESRWRRFSRDEIEEGAGAGRVRRVPHHQPVRARRAAHMTTGMPAGRARSPADTARGW
ncbi:hypothetical protein GCM10010346_61150 [Streptomyces chryseus]|uniref:Uncharacterized protein n=1 Tax=Streptomyces chryseus TaxID=68186 RepID=A0ABQ3E878_9ACTN|nr:hypothetical protein GCM10010346_61150 [Streptomyces chryseus]